jgi:hypothetical protein
VTVALAELGVGCVCVAAHYPSAYVPTRHHIIPQSWGGPSVPENMATICPSTHTAVHRLIDEYVRHKGDPGWDVRKHFSSYQRELALRAWNARPDHPTITSLERP